jgi:hypothetical protein
MFLLQNTHGMNNIVIGGKTYQVCRHVIFDADTHERALRIMHSLQLPQLPQSGRRLSTRPIARPMTASTNRGTAINIVIITGVSGVG